ISLRKYCRIPGLQSTIERLMKVMQTKVMRIRPLARRHQSRSRRTMDTGVHSLQPQNLSSFAHLPTPAMTSESMLRNLRLHRPKTLTTSMPALLIDTQVGAQLPLSDQAMMDRLRPRWSHDDMCHIQRARVSISTISV